jgi:uncharacterized cupredoxin-like copper-binding protein
VAALAHTSAADMGKLMSGATIEQLPDSGGRVSVHLDKGRSAGPLKTVRTRKAAHVEIVATSSQAEELHLHGYDIKLQLKPGETQSLRVHATRSGRFELETHSTHKAVLILEVLP